MTKSCLLCKHCELVQKDYAIEVNCMQGLWYGDQVSTKGDLAFSLCSAEVCDDFDLEELQYSGFTLQKRGDV